MFFCLFRFVRARALRIALLDIAKLLFILINSIARLKKIHVECSLFAIIKQILVKKMFYNMFFDFGSGGVMNLCFVTCAWSYSVFSLRAVSPTFVFLICIIGINKENGRKIQESFSRCVVKFVGFAMNAPIYIGVETKAKFRTVTDIFYAGELVLHGCHTGEHFALDGFEKRTTTG